MCDNRRLVWLNEALKVITPEGATQLPDVQLVMLMTTRKKLKNLPTVDAMEVVHGEWTVIEDDYNDDTIYQCSVCKEEFVTIDDTPADGVTINDVSVPVRCRDCKYYKPQNGSVRWNHKTPYCMRKTVMKVSPDFCSFGEREVK